MTRKHFVAVAAAIAAIETPARRKEEAQRLATEFAKLNQRFDRARFMAACGC